MTAAFTLHFGNLLLSGLLAGSEVGVHYGVGAPPAIAHDTTQIQIRQAAGRRLRLLMPGLFMLTLITGIGTFLVDRGSAGSGLRWTAVICLMVWIATRVFITVSVNSAMLDWSPAAPPANWKDRIALAQRFHIFGVWASVFAFASFLAADLLMFGTAG